MEIKGIDQSMPHINIKLWAGKFRAAEETRLVIIESDNCQETSRRRNVPAQTKRESRNLKRV